MTTADNWTAYELLRGRRLVNSWGMLYGVPDPDDLNDDLVSEDLPYVEWVYRFHRHLGSHGVYLRREENP